MVKIMVKILTMNTYMSLRHLKLCTHIWSTNINFNPPLTLEFLVRLGVNFRLVGELAGGVSIEAWACDIFCHRRTET